VVRDAEKVWARVLEPGHAREVSERTVRDAHRSGLPLSLRVRALGGTMISGTLFAANGLPTVGKYWQLRGEEGPGEPPKQPNYIGPSGAFSVELTEEGVHWRHFEGWPPEASEGTALVGPIHVDPARPVAKRIEVGLQGSGVLRGRVLDREGEPFSKGRIVVCNEPLSPRSSQPPTTRWPTGRHEFVSTKTDANGDFELRGLALRTFHVYAQPSWTGFGARLRAVSPERVPSDGTHRLYQIRPPELTVFVLDANGEPVDLEAHGGPSVAVTQSSESGVTGGVHGGDVGPGAKGFPLRVGSTYDIALLAEGRRPQRHRVTCTGAPIEVRFELDGRAEQGRLEVAIDRSPNVAVAHGLTWVRLHDIVTGARVEHAFAPEVSRTLAFDRMIPGSPSSFSLTAPPGEYLLRLRFLEAKRSVPSEPGFALADRRVEVQEGRTSRVTVLLQRPAHLRLRTANHRAVSSTDPAAHESESQLRSLLERIDLGMRASAGGPWMAMRFLPMENSTQRLFFGTASRLRYEDGLLADLSPGDYVLAIDSPSSGRTEIPLSISPGETREVILPLD